MIFKRIGTNIKFLRKTFELSQHELADKLNITRQQVANYEKGETTIPFNSLYKMSEIFNISLDDLISDALEQKFNLKGIEKTEGSELFLQKRNVRISHKEIASYFIMHFDTFMKDDLINLKIKNLVKDGVIEYLEKNITSKK